MRLKMRQTKNKSDDEPRELNVTFFCFYFINFKAVAPFFQ